MKEHTNLGDLVIALMAFDYSQGIQTNSEMKHASQTYQPIDNFIIFTRNAIDMGNDEWKKHPQVKNNNLRCIYELEQYKNKNKNNK